jgi:hypothetical protein
MKLKLKNLSALTFAAFIGGSSTMAMADPRPEDVAANEAAAAALAAVSDNRASIIDGIVAAWEAEAAAMGYTEGWAAEFTALLQGATDQQLMAIQDAASYEGVRAILQGRDAPVQVDGVVGTTALGDLNQDLVFTPVVPCRIFDTRFDIYPLPGGNPGSQLDYYVYGSAALLAPQGHTAGTGCAAPKPVGSGETGEPVAIAANFTVVPYGKGHIRVWPFAAPQPNASFLNYNSTVNSNLANAGIVATCYACGLDLSVSTWFGSADSLADVMGYFYAAPVSDLSDAVQGGYDLAVGGVAGTGQDYFTDGFVSATFIGATNGNTTLTFNGGEEVTMRGSGDIYNSAAAGATVDGTYFACYTDGTNLFQMASGFSNEAPFCTTLNASGHGGTVTTSGYVSSMPAGTYSFGICAVTGGYTNCTPTAPHPGYSNMATKIEVIRLKN